MCFQSGFKGGQGRWEFEISGKRVPNDRSLIAERPVPERFQFPTLRSPSLLDLSDRDGWYISSLEERYWGREPSKCRKASVASLLSMHVWIGSHCSCLRSGVTSPPPPPKKKEKEGKGKEERDQSIMTWACFPFIYGLCVSLYQDLVLAFSSLITM